MERCQSCNKFCSAEVQEPSVNNIEVDFDIEAMRKWKPGDESFLTITAEVELEKSSECCGDSVSSATVNVEHDVTDEDVLLKVKNHFATISDDDADIDIEDEECCFVEQSGKGKDKIEEHVDVQWRIYCNGDTLGEGTVSGDIEEWEDY